MPIYDIANATLSDSPINVTEYVIPPTTLNAAQGSEETEYQNTKFKEQWDIFNAVPDLRSAILMKAIWTMGKGWTADAKTTVLLNHVSGAGKDTFDDILFNLVVCAKIGGDSYAEIINDSDEDLLNLKPLDPGSIKIIVNPKGQIIRYEQTSKIKEGLKRTWKPKDIFHLSNNRIADSINGLSEIESLKKTILAEEQSFDDLLRITHQIARPMILFKLKTDNQTKINNFRTKMEEGLNKGKNLYIPDDEDLLTWEIVKLDVDAVVLAWRQDVRNKFYRAIGLPLVIFGNAGSTESGGKIEYLAHEQVFERDQRYLEQQLLKQLKLTVNLIPPTSLLENLQRDESKDSTGSVGFQTNDVQAGVGA